MKRILILEDNYQRMEGFASAFADDDLTFVDLPEMAIGKLALFTYDWVFLDHDLGGLAYCPSDEKSGYAVAEWLSQNPERLPAEKVAIHSWNTEGVTLMQAVLSDHRDMVEYAPYSGPEELRMWVYGRPKVEQPTVIIPPGYDGD